MTIVRYKAQRLEGMAMGNDFMWNLERYGHSIREIIRTIQLTKAMELVH